MFHAPEISAREQGGDAGLTVAAHDQNGGRHWTGDAIHLPCGESGAILTVGGPSGGKWGKGCMDREGMGDNEPVQTILNSPETT